jgi:hypothetical protein
MTSSSSFSAFLDERALLEDGESDPDVEYDVSEMDWTPTGPAGLTTLQTMRPMLERVSETSPQISPSVFAKGRGTLPPAPAHPSHRAARPTQPNAFEERGMRAKGGLLAGESESEADTSELAMNLFGRHRSSKARSLTTKLADRKEIPMADPKLHFLYMNGGSARTNGGEEETGLEGLFNSVFSLSDDPKEVRDGQRNAAQRRAGIRGAAIAETQTAETPSPRFRLVILLGVLLALAAISSQGFASGVFGDLTRSWMATVKQQAESFLPVKKAAASVGAFPIGTGVNEKLL